MVDSALRQVRAGIFHLTNDCFDSMTDRLIWIGSPAIFSIIGMTAGYLNNSDYTIVSSAGGCLVGFAIAAFAPAGEKLKP